MATAAETRIAAAEPRHARLIRLAMLASLAVRIEPPLLRALRLRFMPDAEPGIEADLWFSAWMDASDDSACTLAPDIAAVLRQRLRLSGELAAVWMLQQRLHRELPASLRLEEQIAYLDAAATDADADADSGQAAVAAALRTALKAMLSGPQRGEQVARWALQALPRLPAAVRSLPEARQLQLGSESRLQPLSGGSPWRSAPLLDPQTDRWVLPSGHGSTSVSVGLRREGARLLVYAVDTAAPSSPDPAVLRLPGGALARLQLRVTTSDGVQHHAALRAKPGQSLLLPGEPVDIEITTEFGDVCGFAPEISPPEPPIPAPPASPRPLPLPRFANPQWRQLGGMDWVSLNFQDERDPGRRPVPVRRDDGRGRTQAFMQRYRALFDDLLAKISADLAVSAAPKPVPRWVIGAHTPELAAAVQRFAYTMAEREPLLALDARRSADAQQGSAGPAAGRHHADPAVQPRPADDRHPGRRPHRAAGGRLGPSGQARWRRDAA